MGSPMIKNKVQQSDVKKEILDYVTNLSDEVLEVIEFREMFDKCVNGIDSTIRRDEVLLEHMKWMGIGDGTVPAPDNPTQKVGREECAARMQELEVLSNKEFFEKFLSRYGGVVARYEAQVEQLMKKLGNLCLGKCNEENLMTNFEVIKKEIPGIRKMVAEIMKNLASSELNCDSKGFLMQANICECDDTVAKIYDTAKGKAVAFLERGTLTP
jgi:hypothetical protein